MGPTHKQRRWNGGGIVGVEGKYSPAHHRTAAVATGQGGDADYHLRLPPSVCCSARTTMSVQFGGIARTL
jgi:hypothetical protein